MKIHLEFEWTTFIYITEPKSLPQEILLLQISHIWDASVSFHGPEPIYGGFLKDAMSKMLCQMSILYSKFHMQCFSVVNMARPQTKIKVSITSLPEAQSHFSLTMSWFLLFLPNQCCLQPCNILSLTISRGKGVGRNLIPLITIKKFPPSSANFTFPKFMNSSHLQDKLL